MMSLFLNRHLGKRLTTLTPSNLLAPGLIYAFRVISQLHSAYIN